MSSDNMKVSGVTYKRPEDGYFEKRQLRRAAGVLVSGVLRLPQLSPVTFQVGTSD